MSDRSGFALVLRHWDILQRMPRGEFFADELVPEDAGVRRASLLIKLKNAGMVKPVRMVYRCQRGWGRYKVWMATSRFWRIAEQIAARKGEEARA